jgi:hypothetical protein
MNKGSLSDKKVAKLIREAEHEAFNLEMGSLTDVKIHTKGAAPLALGKNAQGITVTHNGKKFGRPLKRRNNQAVKLTKQQTRELFSQIFDLNAPDIFRIAFELAKTDKDMLKFLIDHRLGKAATTLAGDELAPLTLIVRRGTDQTGDL